MKKAALLLLFACGCSAGGGYMVAPSLRSAQDLRVAVLPFDNQTTSLRAEELMRKLTADNFRKRGYAPLASEDTDVKLRGIGITDGGQLPSVTPEKIGEALGVDLLCYGDVQDFTFQNIGFVVRKNVKVQLKLVSASTGETVYEGYGSGKDIKVYVDQQEAKAAFVEQMAVKLVQNIFKTPLKREAETAVWKAMDRLPRR